MKLYFFKVSDHQTQTLLGALAAEFESEGIQVSHSAKYCPELLTEAKVYSRRQPTKAQLRDIAFGWKIAKRMADLDVGQSIVVSGKSTIAVEALEGTDRNIRRAGELSKGGFTVIKVAKEAHDMRFDVPTVGPDTIEAMHQAGGAVLALESSKTIILDREATVARADRHGIVLLALSESPEIQESPETPEVRTFPALRAFLPGRGTGCSPPVCFWLSSYPETNDRAEKVFPHAWSFRYPREIDAL